MKVLFVNTNDLYGGAARAAYRIHSGLRCIGVDSLMLVGNKTSDDDSIIGPAAAWEKGMRPFRSKMDASPLRFYRSRDQIIFSLAWLPDGLAGRVSQIDPDVVHLHWVCGGFLRIETIRRFLRPIVWTLHDMWAFTGGCHIDKGCDGYVRKCGKCPSLASSMNWDLSRWVWKRKHKAWQDLNITVVAPSRWLAGCAGSSSLFGKMRVEVIPNGLDLSVFKPFNKRMARELLNLPQNKKLILFGAMNSINDKYKGFQLLQPALRQLMDYGWSGNVELIVFGASRPASPPDLGMKALYVGCLSDDISLSLLYAAADVYVSPSIADNLPNTVMESLACGTPCVAFDIGGMSDMIEHKTTGYLARPFDAEELSRGIAWVLEDEDRWQRLSFQAREKVEKEFDIQDIARRYAELYEELLGE